MPFYGYVQTDGGYRYVTRNADNHTSEFMNLQSHRTHNVRDSARAAQLAYGFLRDVPYRMMESRTNPRLGVDIRKWNDIVNEVKRLATKFSRYGNTEFNTEIDNWLDVMT